jgi:hypothetical protein
MVNFPPNHKYPRRAKTKKGQRAETNCLTVLWLTRWRIAWAFQRVPKRLRLRFQYWERVFKKAEKIKYV